MNIGPLFKRRGCNMANMLWHSPQKDQILLLRIAVAKVPMTKATFYDGIDQTVQRMPQVRGKSSVPPIIIRLNLAL